MELLSPAGADNQTETGEQTGEQTHQQISLCCSFSCFSFSHSHSLSLIFHVTLVFQDLTGDAVKYKAHSIYLFFLNRDIIFQCFLVSKLVSDRIFKIDPELEHSCKTSLGQLCNISAHPNIHSFAVKTVLPLTGLKLLLANKYEKRYTLFS